jgi:hypothetical protein
MTWLVTGNVSSCSEGNYHHAGRRLKLSLFTSLTRVCAFFCHFIWTAFKFETELLVYPAPDSDVVNPQASNKTTELVPASPPTQGQPQQPTVSPSDSDVHTGLGTSPFQNATLGELERPASLRDRTPDPNDLPSQLPGRIDKPRPVPEEDDDSEGPMEHRGKLVTPDASSEKEVARLEHERFADLERQLSETLAAKTERDRHIVQLTDQLAQKSALLEQAEAIAAETRERAGLELRELQMKLDQSLQSRDHALEQAEANAAEAKKRAGQELRELQAKLDELMQSRDEHVRTLEQAQSALPKATSYAADANERSQRAREQIGEYQSKLAEVRAELEEKKSELEAVRLQLTDAKDGGAKSSAKAEDLCPQNTAGPVNTDEDRVTRGIMERMRAMEAEIASLRWGDKNFERMECSNEG